MRLIFVLNQFPGYQSLCTDAVAAWDYSEENRRLEAVVGLNHSFSDELYVI